MEHLIELMEDSSVDHFVMARDCHVHKDRKDTIKFKNGTHTDYTVRFIGEGPLQQNHFVIRADQTTLPISLREDLTPGIYSYLLDPVKATRFGAAAADPNVIVL